MMLPLTDEEQRELADVLDTRLLELHEELVHTDDRAYRSDLRDRITNLERLASRLKQSSTGEEVYV